MIMIMKSIPFEIGSASADHKIRHRAGFGYHLKRKDTVMFRHSVSVRGACGMAPGGNRVIKVVLLMVSDISIRDQRLFSFLSQNLFSICIPIRLLHGIPFFSVLENAFYHF